MKKKILTLLLSLVMCFTVLLTVSGCEAKNSKLEVATATIETYQYVPDYHGEQDAQSVLYAKIDEALAKVGVITYKVKDASGVEKTEREFENFAEFRAAGGTVSNFDIKRVGSGVLTLNYQGASCEVSYTVKANGGDNSQTSQTPQKHDFTDSNSDGNCDVSGCGKAETDKTVHN